MSDPTPNFPSGIDRENPWPGLASFTEDSREFFFGREKETDELSRLVRRQTLTVLFGQSGLGKSSLLHAGLFPLLRETDHLPLYLRLDHSGQLPIGDRRLPIEQTKHLPEGANASASLPFGNRQSEIGNSLADQVKAALTAAFAAVKAEAPAFRADETLWEYFHRKDVDIWSAKNRLLTPVLAFDQFEEIFTLGRADEASRERSRVFLAELACLVENRAPAAVQAKLDSGALDPAGFNFAKPSCQVILSLREDFLPDLEGLKQSMPALVHNRLRLKKLSGTQALEIVTKPAPHLLAEGVAEKIVEFVAGARGGSAERLAELDVEPPLLSVICRELNDRRRALGQAQITADLVSGNRREILTDFYERSVADLPAPVRTFVEDHLLTKSGFRDNLALETALEFPGVTRPLLDTLVARRLLRIEDRLGVQRVELTHDVLAEVIRASRDARQQRLALEQAQERERDALAAAARHTRRQRWIIGGLATAVAALLVGAVFGIRAQLAAKKQSSRNDLILGSQLLDEGKLADGIAHLVRAARSDPLNDVIPSRLLSTLASQNFAFPVGAPLDLPAPAVGAIYFPDGSAIGYQGQDGVIRVIDAMNWKVAGTWKFDHPVEIGSVRTDDACDLIALKLVDGQIVICDSTGKVLRAGIRPPDGRGISAWGGTAQFSLSPDGRWLGASDDAQLWLWDAKSGALRVMLPHNGVFQFSPDSRRVATFSRQDNQSHVYTVPEGRPIGAPIVYAHAGSSGRFFSRDGERMFIVHTAGVQAYEIATGKPVGPLLPSLAGAGGGYSAMLSPDGKSILFTGNKAVLLDVATGQLLFPPLEHGGRIRNAGFSRDGKTLFTNAADGLFRLWDLQTGRLLGAPMHRQDRFTPAALSPDGRQVAVFTRAGPVRRLQFRGQTAAALDLPRPGVAGSNFLPGTPARVIWFTPRETKTIDIASGRVVPGGFPLPFPAAACSTYGGTAEPGDAYFGRAGPKTDVSAVIMGENGSLARTVTLAGSTGTQASLFSVNMAPGRNHFASANGRTITIWDLRSGRRISTIEPKTGLSIRPGASFAARNPFNRDESRIAYLDNRWDVHVCEVATGAELFTVKSGGADTIQAFRFAPTGALLTGGSEGGLQAWDTAGHRSFAAHVQSGTILRFDISHDDRLFATIADDNTAEIWECATYRHVSSIPIDLANGTRVEFSWDGARLIAPWHSGARVWDVRSGQPVTGELEHEAMVTNLYGPDGRFVTTLTGAGSPESVQRLWSVPPRAAGRATPDWLLDLATLCAGERLTADGELVPAADDFASLDQVRRTIQALPASDPFAEWAQWIVSNEANRPIAPGFTITPAEANKLRAELRAAPAATR